MSITRIEQEYYSDVKRIAKALEDLVELQKRKHIILANSKMEEFWQIISKPEKECDSSDLHIRHCWNTRNFRSIFNILGIDVSHLS